MSPRTSSQHSVHSAGASDKASKASASPRHPSSHTIIKTESPVQSQGPISTVAGPSVDPREPPNMLKSPEGHAANMEGASGVPAKIDEGVEPD